MPNLRSSLLRPRFIWLPLLVMAIGLVLQVRGAWQDSLTNDEITHIAAGVSYWRTDDFRLNDPHPSLFKVWSALPLLAFPHLNLDTSSAAWKMADQWTIGEQFAFHSSTDISYSRWIVFAARLPMILLWAAIGWMLFVWSKVHWNEWGGLITLSAYTFDPNFLGHGHLVNNDVAVAGAFVAAMWAAEKLFTQPSWKRTWVVAILAALTVLMKFSGIFIYPIIAAFAIFFAWRKRSGYNWKWFGRLCLVGVISFLAMSWVAYGFTFGRPFHYSVHNDLAAHKYIQAGVAVLSKIPLPAPRFYTGLRYVFFHNQGGHPAFLLGQTNETGWWYYFPTALAVKTPILTLFVFALVIGLGWWRFSRRSINWFLLALYALPPLLFLAWSMTSHINIGLRHVFEVYPFLFAALGGIILFPKKFGVSEKTLALGISFGWLLVALIAGSHTIGYFNAASGGTNNGHTILRDSNLDWQQDVWRLKAYMNQHNITTAHIDLNGATDTSYFFPTAQAIETDGQIADGAVPRGTYAVSVRWLFDASRHLLWLRKETPKTIVGSTIWVYQF